jgi:hypothetical protein
MMRLRRASAIVTLSVLASAATAYAECAWVLWEESPQRTYGDVTDPARRWTPIGGYANTRDCRAAVEQIYSEANRKGVELSTRPVCLPDTVDPRGPQGK